jgi:4-oxalmesaconate hydratase
MASNPHDNTTEYSGERMIIDIHGHYTTAPKALEEWRNRQIAGLKDPALMPKVADLKISDDDLR